MNTKNEFNKDVFELFEALKIDTNGLPGNTIKLSPNGVYERCSVLKNTPIHYSYSSEPL